MSHALCDRPSSGVGALRPPRFGQLVGESVEPGLDSVELIEDAGQLRMHRDKMSTVYEARDAGGALGRPKLRGGLCA